MPPRRKPRSDYYVTNKGTVHRAVNPKYDDSAFDFYAQTTWLQNISKLAQEGEVHYVLCIVSELSKFMINKVNGKIEIGNVRVSPSTTLSNFSKSILGISSKVLVKNNDYVTLQVDTNSQIGLNLSFSNNRLSTVIIYLKSPESSWSSWSKYEEHEKKTEHNNILNADLGLEPYRFSWGEVESISDSKSGGSYVLVKYRMK